MHADDGIHFGHPGDHVVGVSLRHATRDYEGRALAVFLEPREVQYGFDGLFLGGADKRAGVHDDDVRVPVVVHHGVAGPGELAQHDFGIHQVLRTAQAGEADIGQVLTPFASRRHSTQVDPFDVVGRRHPEQPGIELRVQPVILETQGGFGSHIVSVHHFIGKPGFRVHP